MASSRLRKPAQSSESPSTFKVGKKTGMGASGAIVGAIVAGPIGALVGGVVGTAFGAAADSQPKKKSIAVPKGKSRRQPAQPVTEKKKKTARPVGSARRINAAKAKAKRPKAPGRSHRR